jgi:hypothetical protein
MNEPFVPLSNVSVPGGDRSGLHVTIIGQTDKLQAFQPLGRAGHGGASGQCEPRVTLQRDGDRISAIRIQCACGQVVELACVYEKAKG